jgi:hypothetical protein
MLCLVFQKHCCCCFAYVLIALEPLKSIKFRQPKDMEKEKVIQIPAEDALMSLAHEILRNRNRMDLEQIREKAQAVIELSQKQNTPSLAFPKTTEDTSTPLEEVLLAPVEEATFEPITQDFVSILFEGNTADYKRVVSVLQSKQSKAEAVAFIEQMVQPDYDWSEKENEVAAFMEYISKNYST